MFRLSVALPQIAVAHRLPLGEGNPCSRLHGHNIAAQLVFSARNLDDKGMTLNAQKVEDFGAHWRILDHTQLEPVKNAAPFMSVEELTRPFKPCGKAWGPDWLIDSWRKEHGLIHFPVYPTMENLALLLFGWAEAWLCDLRLSVLLEKSVISEGGGAGAEYARD